MGYFKQQSIKEKRLDETEEERALRKADEYIAHLQCILELFNETVPNEYKERLLSQQQYYNKKELKEIESAIIDAHIRIRENPLAVLFL